MLRAPTQIQSILLYMQDTDAADNASQVLIISIIVISFLSLLTIILIIKSKRALQDQIKLIKQQQNEIEQKNESLGLHLESLKELNTEKNNIISMAAHDLRTPLSNMEGLANLVMLESDKLSPEQKKYIGLIQETSQKARASVGNILDVHKIEAEFDQMVLTNENIVSLVNEVAAIHRPAADQKRIKIEIESDHVRTNQIATDRAYFKQIISNILTNAIRFSHEEDRIVILILETENTFKISIIDHGMGIDNEVMERLFRPYSRITQADGDHVTGLGLTITRKLVEKLNGKLRVESEVGKGSTFMVEFFRS